MSNDKHSPSLAPSAVYKQHEGAAVFTYINNTILDYVAEQPILRIGKHESVPNDDSMKTIIPSDFALYAVGRKLNHPFHRFNDINVIEEFCDLDDATLRRMRHNTSDSSGVADLDFTGHFAPGVAANIVGAFVQEGIISDAQHRAFTLTDYANIINTGWFSTIMHTFARAENGVYARFGSGAHDYKTNALRSRIIGILPRDPKTSNTPLFSYAEEAEPEDGYSYYSASVTPHFVRSLRKQLRRGGAIRTLGCPVARHNVTLDDTLAEESRPVQELIQSNDLQPSGKQLREESDRTHYELPYSTIDNALILLGQRLVTYDKIYGTPRPHTSRLTGKRVWQHKQEQPVDVLRYPTQLNER